jgi:hypothetical protein
LKDRNIALYVVGERGLMAPPSNADRAVNRRQPINVRAAPPNDGAQNPGLEDVAQSTGGAWGSSTATICKVPFRKRFDDTAATYTLGFYPSEATLDGALHPLRVKVARKGVERGIATRIMQRRAATSQGKMRADTRRIGDGSSGRYRDRSDSGRATVLQSGGVVRPCSD